MAATLDFHPDCRAALIQIDALQDGVTHDEFMRQLVEQQTTMNGLTADQIIDRRDAIVAAGGTDGVRSPKAQRQTREEYAKLRVRSLERRGMSIGQAKQATAAEMKNMHALHALDIIADGDPDGVSGMGDGRVNSQLGGEWKRGRAAEVEAHARKMRADGKGHVRMNMQLERCR